MYWRTDLEIPERPFPYTGAKHKAHGTLIHDVRSLYRPEIYLRSIASGAPRDLQMDSPDASGKLADSLLRYLSADYPEPKGRPDVAGRNSEIACAFFALRHGSREKQEVASRGAFYGRRVSLHLMAQPGVASTLFAEPLFSRYGVSGPLPYRGAGRAPRD